jgi:hypothetical protein
VERIRVRGRPRARESVGYVAAIAAAMLVALGVRSIAFSSGSFPEGDGGMFYVMVQDLLHHQFALPSSTTYNGARIPFAYPPLGFYVVAVAHTISGLSILNLFRTVPLIVSVLCVGAFGLLARELLASRRAAIIATFVFALLPTSFEWEIQGGGITRAFGMFFALLTLWQSLQAWKGSRRALTLSIPFAALTVLSHPEWAWFTAYSLVLLAAFRALRRDGLLRLAALAAGASVLVLPWLAAVYAMHGVAPFRALLTGQSGVFPWFLGLLNLAGLTLTPSVWFPFGMALGALGGAIALARRDWLLPTWVLAILVIDGRAPLERSVIVLALLAGLGLHALLEARFLSNVSGGDRLARPRVVAVGVCIALLWGMLNTLVWEAKNTATLAPGARSAMTWFKNNTPPGSSAVIITSAYWGLNLEAEWFPALTDRVSLNTVQGSEWVRGQFARRYYADQHLQECAFRGATCLGNWMRRNHLAPDYVYVAKAAPIQLIADAVAPDRDCCWSLRTQLAQDPRYTRVYDGPAASIFRLNRTAGSTLSAAAR